MAATSGPVATSGLGEPTKSVAGVNRGIGSNHMWHQTGGFKPYVVANQAGGLDQPGDSNQIIWPDQTGGPIHSLNPASCLALGATLG
jgi:hypothetical protein